MGWRLRTSGHRFEEVALRFDGYDESTATLVRNSLQSSLVCTATIELGVPDRSYCAVSDRAR